MMSHFFCVFLRAKNYFGSCTLCFPPSCMLTYVCTVLLTTPFSPFLTSNPPPPTPTLHVGVTALLVATYRLQLFAWAFLHPSGSARLHHKTQFLVLIYNEWPVRCKEQISEVE
jgi:hypothetical protein